MTTGAARTALLLGGLGWAVTSVLRRSLLVVTVSGHSMEPTLAPGARVLVRRCPARALRRGAVVVVAPPAAGLAALHAGGADDPTLRRMVKRVAALPGDPVPAPLHTGGGPRRFVPAARFVALGDNIDRSLDSRQLGCFRTADVVGVVVHVLAR